MAHIVDTSVAAVKMSGSFAAPTFSSSEDEEDLPVERRPRSNAVSGSDSKDVPTEASTPCRTIGQPVPNTGDLYLSNSASLACHEADETPNSSLSYVTALSTMSLQPATASASKTETGSLTQRPSNDDVASCQEDIKSNTATCLNQTKKDDVETLRDKSYKNCEVEESLHSQRIVSSLYSDHSQLSSTKLSSASSSPVMMKTCVNGLNGTNCNLSSASATSSGSSSRELYHQSRFNPFDHDIHMEEDHFSDNPESNLFGRGTSSPIRSVSSLSSDQWNDGGSGAGDSDTVTFAELGLAEDHFSHPEGHFGLSQAEELEMAIDQCKELIRKATPHSDRQKNLVQKLVQLRLKLQEMKDEPQVIEKNVVSVLGHRLMRKESRSSKYYCEKCNSIIWGLVQEWRKCLDCGYRCHDKCVSQITRNCAMVKVKENPGYVMEICPRHPKGLLAQDYRCAECKAQISVAEGVEPRLCEYNGRYYCELCHWNDLMYVPAEILLNWEFEKQKVCRASKQFLKLMMKKAVINVQEVNPMLFNYVEQLRDIKHLREELLMMKQYILACPAAMQAKMLLQLSSRPHFVECSDRYSLQDLLDSDERLIPDLVQVHSSWAQHIKTDCELCQGRGFFCELCTSKEVLFPFDSVATVCSSCSAVMHRICFAQQVKCPKCERRRKRQDHNPPES